ncbi:MAG: tyrosine-type recombinase/integrase, partial [Roseburia sp.]|nr:tyrosine-type recombinase/integrase [Roseburia sp.]
LLYSTYVESPMIALFIRQDVTQLCTRFHFLSLLYGERYHTSFFIEPQNIKSGMIFVTRTGKPISRTNIWREMKALCVEANVNPQKVFPHNLRHLFARVFYGIEKDIAKLADILGHSSINTTRIYIISTGTEHRQRMENMRLII